MEVKILEETNKKALGKRLDTIADVYEIFTIKEDGSKRFYKTNRDYNKIKAFYDRL